PTARAQKAKCRRRLEAEAPQHGSTGRSSGLRLVGLRTAFPKPQGSQWRLGPRPGRLQRRPRYGFTPYSLFARPVGRDGTCRGTRSVVRTKRASGQQDSAGDSGWRLRGSSRFAAFKGLRPVGLAERVDYLRQFDAEDRLDFGAAP